MADAHPTRKKRAVLDLTGRKFGRLTALWKLPPDKHKARKWHCLCDCGSTTQVAQRPLVTGTTVSCGCYQREMASARMTRINTKHGWLSRDMPPWASIWKGMIRRCHNPQDPSYVWYGGRGVYVCERWRNNPKAFHEDMGDPPPGTSLDRVDVDGPYCPENCRWADLTTQANNKRNTKWICHDGITDSQAGWARRLGVTQQWLYQTLKRHPFSEAVRRARLRTTSR